MRTTYFPKGAGALYSVTAYIITHSYTSGEHPAGHPELKLFFGMTLRKFLMQKLLDGNYEAVRVSAVLIRNGVCNTQVKEQYTCAELGAFHITFYCTKSFLSVSVSQSNRRLSSERRTLCVPGTLTRQLPLLLDKLQVPELPSLNDNVTGTVGSLTIVAQDVRRKIDASNNTDFMRLPFLMLISIELPYLGIDTSVVKMSSFYT